MQVALRHGIRGLGDEYDYGGEYAPVAPVVISSDPAPNPLTGNYDYGGEYGYGVPTNTVSDAQLAADYRALIESGKAGGMDIGTPTSISAPNLAAALKTGALVLSKLTPSGAKVCPSGYATPAGVCVSVTPGPKTPTAPLIAGISNQTLAIAGIVIFGLVMLGSKKR